MDPLSRLLAATKKADYDEIVAALQDGADPNHKNDKGETSVMLLSERVTEFDPWEIDDSQHVERNVTNCLELLSSQGANILSTNNFGQNALFYAAGSFGTVQLKWLLNKADGKFWVNGYDMFGNSCLHGRQKEVGGEDFIEAPDCHSISILCHFGGATRQPNVKSGKKPPRMPCIYQSDHHCWAYQDFLKKVTYLREKKWLVSDRSKATLWANELTQMAEVKIVNDLSLRDLLSQNRYVMSRIIDNEYLQELHRDNNGDFTGTFPEFGLILNGKMKQAMHRDTMIDKFSQIMIRLTECHVNEIDVYRKIFKYLPDWQLRFHCAHDFDKYFPK